MAPIVTSRLFSSELVGFFFLLVERARELAQYLEIHVLSIIIISLFLLESLPIASLSYGGWISLSSPTLLMTLVNLQIQCFILRKTGVNLQDGHCFFLQISIIVIFKVVDFRSPLRHSWYLIWYGTLNFYSVANFVLGIFVKLRDKLEWTWMYYKNAHEKRHRFTCFSCKNCSMHVHVYWVNCSSVAQQLYSIFIHGRK